MCCLLAGSTAAAAQVCTVSTTPIVFGQFDPFSASATDAAGTVVVSCQAVVSVSVTYTLTLDGGGAGLVNARRMSGVSSQLFYQIYTTAGRTTVWGDGTAGSVAKADGYLLGVLVPVVKTYTAYGRISARQNISAGNYADLVTIVLTY